MYSGLVFVLDNAAGERGEFSRLEDEENPGKSPCSREDRGGIGDVADELASSSEDS
jgi:hypothetical protein